MVLAGDNGKLRVGYQLAATIRGWVVTSQHLHIGNATTTLAGVVDTLDSYWSTQRPLTLGLWVGQAWWVWDMVEMESGIAIVKGTIALRLPGNPIAVANF